MAAVANPSVRDQVLGVLAIEIPHPTFVTPSTWPDDLASQRVRKLLGAASSNLLAWPQDTNGYWIERSELSELETAIAGRDGKAIALLGPAGSGKSALLARLGAGLAAKGYVLLAIKADMLPRHVSSIDDLDREWGFVETLPVVLERLVAESPVAVLIDQLDALASLMDAHSERLTALLSLINRLSLTPRIVVIVSCRSFDAEHDMRLRSLIQPAKPITLADLPWDGAQKLLLARGFQPAKWPQSIRELLSRPQHLKTFLRYFPPDSGQPAFASLQAMLERILQDRVVNTFGLPAADALDAIANEMSISEELWVPLAALQKRFPLEIRQLQQADLIRTDQAGLRLGFVHQTLFEFLRGRSFVFGNVSLCDEVKAKQDGLAIRPVLWSAISYLRNGDLAVYRHELKALFESFEVRLHVKLLLVDFLGTVGHPLVEEAECLKSVLKHKQIRPHVMRAIEKKPAWFPLIRDAVVRCNEDGPDGAWQASWVLGPALTFDRAFVLSALESSWLPKPELDRGTFNVFREFAVWDERAARIIERIVGRTAIAPTFVCKLAESMAKARPDLAANLVRIKLDLDLVQARSEATPPAAPLGGDATAEDQIQRYFRDDEGLRPLRDLLKPHGDWHDLRALAKLGPADLIEALWTWVEEVALLLSTPTSPGLRCYRTDYEWDFGASVHSCSYLAQTIWSATAAFASADPARFLRWSKPASDSEALAVHRLIVYGLIQIANEHPAAVVDYLMGDYRRLHVGHDSTGKHGIRDLLEVVKESLSKQQMEDLLARIESWNPYDLAVISEARRATYEEATAETRLDLLSALVVNKLKSGSQTQALPDEESEGVVVARPPVVADAMEKMSDAEILSLLAKWPDGREHNEDYRFGRSFEVATQFGEFTRRQPARGMSIIRQLRPGVQEGAAGAGLDALASDDALNPEAVCEGVHHLLNTFHSDAFRDRAAWALVRMSQRGDGLKDQAISDLKGLLAEPESEETVPASNFFHKTDQKATAEKSVLWDLRSSGLPNGNYPVLLALTLGLLRREPADRDAWLKTLENHIEKNERPRVWQALLDQLRYLSGCERVRSSELVERLFEKYPSLTSTVEGVRFIASNHFWLPSSFFHDSIGKLEQSTWPRAQRAAGELWMLRAGLVPEDTIGQQRLATALRELEAGRSADFLLGFVTSAAETWMTARFRETSTVILLAAAPKAEGEVAEAIASALGQNEGEQLPGDTCTDQLLAALTEGSVLLATSHTNSIAARLKELLQKGYSARAAGRVARRMVEVAGTAIADISSAHYLAGDDLIDISTWIFEQLLAMNAYKVQETVTALDQRIG